MARLADHVGATVRVGGLIVDVMHDSISIDDGTAIGHVVLTGEAATYLPLLEPADAVNIVGRVRRSDGGTLEVVADAGSAVARVGDPTLGEAEDAAIEPAEPGVAGGPESMDPRPRAPMAAGGGLLDTGPLGAGLAAPLTGLVSLAAISLASVGITILRRRRADRRLARKVVQRLAALTRPIDTA
jgi:hypothetical protein